MTQAVSDNVLLNKSEHKIGNTTYIVKSLIKKDAEKTILSKIYRLIKRELEKTWKKIKIFSKRGRQTDINVI